MAENNHDLSIVSDLIRRRYRGSFETLCQSIIISSMKERLKKMKAEGRFEPQDERDIDDAINAPDKLWKDLLSKPSAVINDPVPDRGAEVGSKELSFTNSPVPPLVPALPPSLLAGNSAPRDRAKSGGSVYSEGATASGLETESECGDSTPTVVPVTLSAMGRRPSLSELITTLGASSVSQETTRKGKYLQNRLERLLSKDLSAQKALLTGPWPALLTTNWDLNLEWAWKHLNSLDEISSGLDVEYMRRLSALLPVRYRSDVSQFFAEIRTELLPPRVFKLHGDFTDKGKKEFVADHADYRRLIVRDISSLSMLRYMSTTYSFLFYGYSLQDKDLLGILDEIVETLGIEAGPHFWIVS
jgi:hypothetical protein